ncbi:MAG: dihydrofolate synthase/folylpolyglutamate synthase [Candidatus Omnitrophota bacterium]|jgi:dihydrofolate synthase/folylpolyglutamate synthase
MSKAEGFFNSYINLEKTGEFNYGRTLDRMRQLLIACDSPHKSIPKTIIVAGSKGKGSTSEMLNCLLQSAGLRVGLYTSPHLLNWTERIRVQNVAIEEAQAQELIENIFESDACKQLTPEPTYFEWMTALAWLYFKSQGVDVVIMEVGLGGRFDATNAHAADMAIITPIGLEHQQVLGDTVAKIAKEKSGVIHSGQKVILARQAKEAHIVLAEAAIEAGAEYIDTFKQIKGIRQVLSGSGSQTLIQTQTWGELEFELPVLGQHQIENACTAIVALEQYALSEKLDITADKIKRGLNRIQCQGRVQVLRYSPQPNSTWIVDGAHNQESARALAEAIRLHMQNKSVHLIMGMFCDKDIEAFMDGIKGMNIKKIYTVNVKSNRSYTSIDLAKALAHTPYIIEVCDDLAQAVAVVEKNRQFEDIGVITGSMYLAGEMLSMRPKDELCTN